MVFLTVDSYGTYVFGKICNISLTFDIIILFIIVFDPRCYEKLYGILTPSVENGEYNEDLDAYVPDGTY